MRNTIAGLLRIFMGWIFFWAFIDKLFGLGYHTAPEAAWINGGSPTSGFLQFGTKGPFAEFFQGLAGQGWVDWAFMIGLALIGIALILGIAMRLATVGGVLMMAFMYMAASIWPENNPFLDDHVIYALVLILLLLIDAGNYLGFGRAWGNSSLVRRLPFLK